jgi:hypothetical protein
MLAITRKRIFLNRAGPIFRFVAMNDGVQGAVLADPGSFDKRRKSILEEHATLHRPMPRSTEDLDPSRGWRN